MTKPQKVKLTPAKAMEAISWGQLALGLDNWRFRVALGDPAPRWVDEDGQGRVRVLGQDKTATVWADPARCEDAQEIIETLFHEILHVYLTELGIDIGTETDETEYRINKLAHIMRLAYQASQK